VRAWERVTVRGSDRERERVCVCVCERVLLVRATGNWVRLRVRLRVRVGVLVRVTARVLKSASKRAC
jgi:hypothetical protein